MGSRSAFDEKSSLAAVWRAKESKMKYWGIIADNLRQSRLELGLCLSD
jgi:phosphopantetheinyl transferase (holo-ACP synthase)